MHRVAAQPKVFLSPWSSALHGLWIAEQLVNTEELQRRADVGDEGVGLCITRKPPVMHSGDEVLLVPVCQPEASRIALFRAHIARFLHQAISGLRLTHPPRKKLNRPALAPPRCCPKRQHWRTVQEPLRDTQRIRVDERLSVGKSADRSTTGP